MRTTLLAAIGYEQHSGSAYCSATLNEILIGWLIGVRTGRSALDADAADRVRACRAAAEGARWASVMERLCVPESLLVEALVTDSLHDSREVIVAGYESTFDTGSTRRERLSVVEHLTTIQAVIPARTNRSRHRQVCTDVGEIIQRVGQWTPD